jgi:hypothetical protein
MSFNEIHSIFIYDFMTKLGLENMNHYFYYFLELNSSLKSQEINVNLTGALFNWDSPDSSLPKHWSNEVSPTRKGNNFIVSNLMIILAIINFSANRKQNTPKEESRAWWKSGFMFIYSTYLEEIRISGLLSVPHLVSYKDLV